MKTTAIVFAVLLVFQESDDHEDFASVLCNVTRSLTLQKELKLSPNQLTTIAKASDEYWKSFFEQFKNSPRVRTNLSPPVIDNLKVYDQLREKLVADCITVLKPNQQKRLKQLSIQVKSHLHRSDSLGFLLPLSAAYDDQSKPNSELWKQYVKVVEEYYERLREKEKELMREILKSLPDEKRKKYSKLVGARPLNSMEYAITVLEKQVKEEKKQKEETKDRTRAEKRKRP